LLPHSNECVAIFVILGVALVTGLTVIPTSVDEAQARCVDGFKKHGDVCEPRKPKEKV
jgi:hypothetical protein